MENQEKNIEHTQNSEFSSSKPIQDHQVSNDRTLIKSPDHQHLGSSKTNSSSPFNDNQLEGKLINGRYQIDKLIGHGGMCDVYRATDMMLKSAGISSCQVALKVLQKEYFNQPNAAKILLREAQKTQQLSHPNIIRVYDFGADNQNHYLVMEWLDGETLEEVIKRSRPNGLSYTNSMKLLKQVLSALTYAHNQGVIHADLKPSNIMLTREGIIKVFDFGVSRALNLNADIYSTEQKDETNALCGYTPTYASPELLKGQEPEIKDDIFAFSCIAYELLTSQHPFNRKPADIAEKMQMKAVKPRNISRKKWRVFQQGLQFNPDYRLQTLNGFHKRLDKRYWPQLTAFAAVGCLCALAGYTYYVKDSEIKRLTAEINQTQQNIKSDHQLANLPALEIIETIPTLSDDKAILKDGILRKNRSKVLSLFENRINDILNKKSTPYPDYYAIEKELLTARALYPDSQRITELSTDITNSWQATIDMLEQRINSLLEKEHYQKQSDGNDIYQMMADLGHVKSDHRFSPSEQAKAMYSKAFKAASEDRNISQLNQVIMAGNLIFTNAHEELTAAIELKEAIQKVTHYHDRLNSGEKIKFPYLAANLYYQNEFKAFNNQLDRVRTVTQLDQLNNKVINQTQTLPNDFSPLIQVRLAMAARYLSFSDQLLKERKARTATIVMKKANNLFALVEEAKTKSASTQLNHG